MALLQRVHAVVCSKERLTRREKEIFPTLVDRCCYGLYKGVRLAG